MAAAAIGAVPGARVHGALADVDNDVDDDFEPDDVDGDRLFPVMTRVLSDLTSSPSVKTLFNCLDSGPLLNVTVVSLKSVPYAFIENTPAGFGNALSCRLRYLESAMMGVASMVYNLFVGILLSVATAFTLGKVPAIADQMKKTWLQTGLAAATAGIGFIGTASPKAAVLSNLAVLFGLTVVLKQVAEQNLVSEICTVYRNHAVELRGAFAEAIPDANLYQRQVVPLFNYLDERSNNISTFDEMLAVGQGVMERSPDVAGAMMYVGRDLLFARFENFLDSVQEDVEGIIG